MLTILLKRHLGTTGLRQGTAAQHICSGENAARGKPVAPVPNAAARGKPVAPVPGILSMRLAHPQGR